MHANTMPAPADESLRQRHRWQCFGIVERKTGERAAKAATAKANKEARVQKKQGAVQSTNDLGARVVAALVHAQQIPKLVRPQLEAALSFRGVAWPQGAL
jgi:hypothetical protein